MNKIHNLSNFRNKIHMALIKYLIKFNALFGKILRIEIRKYFFNKPYF